VGEPGEPARTPRNDRGSNRHVSGLVCLLETCAGAFGRRRDDTDRRDHPDPARSDSCVQLLEAATNPAGFMHAHEESQRAHAHPLTRPVMTRRRSPSDDPGYTADIGFNAEPRR
jgi:hypothetical protein